MSFKSTSRNALLALVCCGLILGACAAYDSGTSPAPAEPPPPPPELTEEQKIVARFIEAVGGEEALRAHTSTTVKGTFGMPAMGVSGDFTAYAMAPDKFLLTINMAGVGDIVQGYNGDVAWAENPMTGTQLVEGEMLEQVKRDSRFYAELEYGELYPQQTAAGETEWNGQAAYQLDLIDAAGNESSHYFSADTGLLIGVEGVQDTEMGRQEVTRNISDYKEFGGLLIGTSDILETMGMEITQTVESVTWDDVDPSVFEPSEAIKALLPE